METTSEEEGHGVATRGSSIGGSKDQGHGGAT
jgi:hypothetical protein